MTTDRKKLPPALAEGRLDHLERTLFVVREYLLITAWYFFPFLHRRSRSPGLLLPCQRHGLLPLPLSGQTLCLRNLRFHLSDQPGQLFLTFGLGAGIDATGVDFPIRPLGGELPLPKVVVDLRHTACPRFANLALVGFKRGLWGWAGRFGG